MELQVLAIILGAALLIRALWPEREKRKRKRRPNRSDEPPIIEGLGRWYPSKQEKAKPTDTSHRVPYEKPKRRPSRIGPRDGEGGHTQTYQKFTGPPPPPDNPGYTIVTRFAPLGMDTLRWLYEHGYKPSDLVDPFADVTPQDANLDNFAMTPDGRLVRKRKAPPAEPTLGSWR